MKYEALELYTAAAIQSDHTKIIKISTRKVCVFCSPSLRIKGKEKLSKLKRVSKRRKKQRFFSFAIKNRKPLFLCQTNFSFFKLAAFEDLPKTNARSLFEAGLLFVWAAVSITKDNGID